MFWFESRKIVMVVLLLAVLFGGAGYAYGSTYYIDGTSGNDTNAGSIGSPWKTIGKANSTLTTGDTVYVRTGTYTQNIRPSNSGTSGNYITYAAYSDETATISNVTYGANLEDRDYIVVDGFHITDISEAAHMFDTNYSIIKNCTIENYTGWAGIFLCDSSSHNQILNNVIDKHEDVSNAGDLIVLGRFAYSTDEVKYNLIEGNVMFSSNRNCHAGIYLEGNATYAGLNVSYNVIRENVGYDMRRWGGGVIASRNLFEDNIGYNSGYNPADTNWNSESFRAGGNDNIWRRNEAYEDSNTKMTSDWAAGMLMLATQYAGTDEPCVGNKVYNNTMYNCSGLALYNALTVAGVDIKEQVYKNNIFDSCGTHNDFGKLQIGYWFCDATAFDDLYDGNLIMRSDGTGNDVIRLVNSGGENLYTLSEAKSSLSGMFLSGNIEGDPNFTDTATADFTLKEGSPCVDAGVSLTLTNGSGSSSTSLTVDDAGYFTDGWGVLAAGDIIQLDGQSTTVEITGINYTTNVLTLGTALTWSDNVGVSLAYNGDGADIGAHESAYGESEENLVAYWNFSENTGSSAADSAGSNDGTISGASWASGYFDYALDFDASGDYIDCDNDSSVQGINSSEDWTLAAWVYADDVTNCDNFIFYKSGSWGVTVSPWGTAGRIVFSEYNTYYNAYSDASALAAGGWHHVALVGEGTLADITFYVDANDVTGGVTGDYAYYGSSGDFNISRSGSYSFDGKLDDVRVYDKALTVAEIQSLYEDTRVPTDQVAHWKLDENTGSTTDDSAGSNDGSITGASWTSGYFDYALSFDGSGDYVDCDNDSSLQGINSSEDWSVSLWIYPNDVSANSDNTILAKGGWSLRLAPWSAGRLIFTEKSTWYNAYTDYDLIEEDQWQHIVLVGQGTLANITFYVNGVNETQGYGADQAYYGSTGDFTISASSNSFDGKIDDVRVFDRALTSDEVTAIYEE